ncbi:MAG: iron-containing alcohol dehydrogenase [Syntrophomonadaceae bacterium]|nr:iron-containing alcohol dehydrogenase [Syntrophomonadaceae bacterium]
MATPKYFVWEYRTLVEVGSGCRTFVAQRFMEMGCKRVAMITDKGLIDAGVADMVKDIFTIQGGVKLAGVYDKIEQDAAMRVINDCARWYRENAFDGMLVLGGGSVMDSAKGVKMLLGNGATDIKNLMPGNLGPYIRPLGKPLGVPNIFIPTTAGTGSEVSPLAVIYNEDDKVKGDVLHPFIPADIALLDPDLTVGLPPGMTVSTGLDALGHAVEGLTSPEANIMSDSLSIHSIKLIMKYLPIAASDGKNLEARTNMLAASNMAIMGFAMGGMMFPMHNVAHAAGGQLRIPHGQAVGVAMPACMEHMPWHYWPKAKELAEGFGVKSDSQDPAELVALAREKVLGLMKECGFKPQFDQALDSQQSETMYWAIKADPTAMLYPIPDDTIRAIISTVFPGA